jgi:hypothetical protein
MKTKITRLALSWSTSKGRDTYGYNICRLDDTTTGERFKCMGGGYDMTGTVFAQWLCANYQTALMGLKDRANYQILLSGRKTADRDDALYGMTYHEADQRIHIDGACGLDCVLRIAAEIGLEVERDYIAKGRRRGETVGWYVSEA